MAGITDLPFRLLMRELGAEVVVSELISAEGFAHGSHKTRAMMRIHEDEHPVGLQIFGTDPHKMAEAALCCEDAGADFVDINFGCPVPKVVSCGAGSAMLRQPVQMARLLEAMRARLSVPLTIKIRSGWDSGSINASEIVRVAAACGVAWVSVHARTREQGYSGLADWELIRGLHGDSPIPIIGNGDLASAELSVERLRLGFCHAVMLGRAALANPFVFLECRKLMGEPRSPVPIRRVLERYSELVLRHTHPLVAHTKLKKLFVWYASGIPGKGLFRHSMFALGNEPDKILAFALDFLTDENLSRRTAGDLSFLKGGHG